MEIWHENDLLHAFKRDLILRSVNGVIPNRLCIVEWKYEEVAEIIEETLLAERILTSQRIELESGPIPNPRRFDAMIIGSFTWDKGATPDEVKDFVADVGYKPTMSMFSERGIRSSEEMHCFAMLQ